MVFRKSLIGDTLLAPAWKSGDTKKATRSEIDVVSEWLQEFSEITHEPLSREAASKKRVKPWKKAGSIF